MRYAVNGANVPIRGGMMELKVAPSNTTYQYWQHKSSGETYAVQLVGGEPHYYTGPLHYEDVEAANPSEYAFDDKWDDDPDKYWLTTRR